MSAPKKLNDKDIGEAVSSFLEPFTNSGKTFHVTFELSEAVYRRWPETAWRYPEVGSGEARLSNANLEAAIRLALAELGYVTEFCELGSFSAEFDDYSIAICAFWTGPDHALPRERIECEQIQKTAAILDKKEA